MIVEFKINKNNEPWADIPSIALDVSALDVSANEIARGLANANSSEVRWNIQGLSQGHYIGVDYKFKKIATQK